MERDARGRFRRGHAGGPGRPKGRRDRATEAAERLMAGDAEEIIAALVEAAKGGDVAASRIVLDRVCPAPRERRVVLADVDPADPCAVADRAIAAALAGELTMSECARLLDCLRARLEVGAVAELEDRLAALEDALGTRET